MNLATGTRTFSSIYRNTNGTINSLNLLSKMRLSIKDPPQANRDVKSLAFCNFPACLLSFDGRSGMPRGSTNINFESLQRTFFMQEFNKRPCTPQNRSLITHYFFMKRSISTAISNLGEHRWPSIDPSLIRIFWIDEPDHGQYKSGKLQALTRKAMIYSLTADIYV